MNYKQSSGKITEVDTKRKKEFNKEECVKRSVGNIKHTNIHIIGVPDGEQREYRAGNIFKGKIAKISLTWKGQKHPGPGIKERSKQDQQRSNQDIL